MRGAPLDPRPGYETIRLYSPGAEPACEIDLSDNTNRWGISPAAVDVLREHDALELTRYPSPYGDELKAAISESLGIGTEMVVTGSGSDGVLEPAIRAFGTAGERMTHADPTFVMAATFGRMNGLAPVPVPLLPTYDVDADAMVRQGARITYLCSPNNPTGNAFSRDALARVVGGTRGLVVIDEAYVEFAGSSALELARTSDRVLLIRTFSKAYGLAGLRVGYGIGAPALVAAVEKARGPYTVGVLSERAAAAAMRHDQEWMRQRSREAVSARVRLEAAVAAMGLEPAPSDANFIFVPVRNAAAIAAHVARAGVRIRAFAGLAEVSPALQRSGGEALRITVAPDPMLSRALDALESAVALEGVA